MLVVRVEVGIGAVAIALPLLLVDGSEGGWEYRQRGWLQILEGKEGIGWFVCMSV